MGIGEVRTPRLTIHPMVRQQPFPKLSIGFPLIFAALAPHRIYTQAYL
jgi:hypothetical protein